MKCASCGENFSIIQSLVGHNCKDRHSELERLALKRLLDATTPDELKRVENKLEKISVVAQSLVVAVVPSAESEAITPLHESADLEPEPDPPVVECSGFWYCTCPRCKALDEQIWSTCNLKR